MAAFPTSKARALTRCWVCAIALFTVALVIPAAAGAVSTPGVSTEATADATDATAGIPDASSLVPRNVCSAPGPGRAMCLAQFLALPGSRTPASPHLRGAWSPFRLRQRPAGTSAAPQATTNPSPAPTPQAGTPAYLQQAYDLSYLSQTYGSDMTVAVIDAYHDATAQDDLATYRSNFSLPACTVANHCFTQIQTSGNTSGSGPPATDPSWALETSLDLDAVSAACPRCQILLVEAASNRSSALATAQAQAASMGADVISDSFGAALQNASKDLYFGDSTKFAFNNVATVAASGDSGYPANNPGASSQDPCATPTQQTPCSEFPAALPAVTAVGSTALAAANGPRGFGESAWTWRNPATKDPTSDGATGSGCDTTAAQPDWQTSLNTGCSGRAYNDISADGDPATGMLVYDPHYTPAAGSTPPPGHTAGDGWVIVGGTSEAAPLVAGYYGLLKSVAAARSQPTTAFDTPEWPYDNRPQLNDPRGGSNAALNVNCPFVDICTASASYDGPTGAGSISGAVVSGAPGIGGPGPSGTDTVSVTSNSAQLQGGVYPNGNATTLWWDYGTTTAYGQSTGQSLLAAGTAPVAASGALSGLQPGTTYHYRLVAQNGLGTMYGYDFTFTTAAAPSNGSGAINPPATGTGGSSSSGGGSQAGGGSTTNPHPARPSPPSVGKLRIAALGGSTVTASASINPHGASTTYHLAYGTARKLGRRARTGSSSSALTMTWRLRGLTPGKVYYLQVMASNGGGSARSAMIRVRTSPVSVVRITRSGGELAVMLRCRGSFPCRMRVNARAAGRTIAIGTFKVRGNRNSTVLLKLNRTAVSRASHGKTLTATLWAVSFYNGYGATVSAKFRLVASA